MKCVLVAIQTDEETAADIMRYGAGRIEDAAAAGSCVVDHMVLMEVVP